MFASTPLPGVVIKTVPTEEVADEAEAVDGAVGSDGHLPLWQKGGEARSQGLGGGGVDCTCPCSLGHCPTAPSAQGQACPGGPTVLTKVIMLTPCASSMVTALVEGSMARAVTGTLSPVLVQAHMEFMGLLWILWGGGG